MILICRDTSFALSFKLKQIIIWWLFQFQIVCKNFLSFVFQRQLIVSIFTKCQNLSKSSILPLERKIRRHYDVIKSYFMMESKNPLKCILWRKIFVLDQHIFNLSYLTPFYSNNLIVVSHFACQAILFWNWLFWTGNIVLYYIPQSSYSV